MIGAESASALGLEQETGRTQAGSSIHVIFTIPGGRIDAKARFALITS